MYRDIHLYNQHNHRWPMRFGWLYFILGANLIFLSILIFIFPEILAFLFGGILLIGGIAIIAIGFGIKNRFSTFSGRYRNIKVE